MRVAWPWALYLLILSIIAVFGYQIFLGDNVATLVADWGLTPRRLVNLKSAGRLDEALIACLTPISATFLHSGYVHLLGNLLYLRVFGERVESALGHIGFLGAYFGAGVLGALVHTLVNPDDPAPMIGASGAIAGVLGIYVVLFPRARVTTLFPAVIVLTFIELPAVVFVGLWAAQQALNGYMVLTEGLGVRDVAWMAHLGGFGFGLGLGLIIRLRRVHRRKRLNRDKDLSLGDA